MDEKQKINFSFKSELVWKVLEKIVGTISYCKLSGSPFTSNFHKLSLMNTQDFRVQLINEKQFNNSKLCLIHLILYYVFSEALSDTTCIDIQTKIQKSEFSVDSIK